VNFGLERKLAHYAKQGGLRYCSCTGYGGKYLNKRRQYSRKYRPSSFRIRDTRYLILICDKIQKKLYVKLKIHSCLLIQNTKAVP
jgi:hypothetical protein